MKLVPRASVMRAEILEQPATLIRVAETVSAHLGRRRLEKPLGRRFLGKLERILVMGSGSSYHAALLARDYLEMLTGISTVAAHASESFRRPMGGARRSLAVAFSHSGSSADVRDAAKRARRQKIPVLAVTNIADSPLVGETDAAVVSGAGAESAIPSTKGFTALVASSLLLAAHVAALRGRPMDTGKAGLLVSRAAAALERWFADVEATRQAARFVARATSVAILGKGLLYPVARDGALKLLEVTYLPALAYPPAEFRHGPIALADRRFALVLLVGRGRDRSRHAIAREVRGAGAALIEIGNQKSPWASVRIPVPRVDALVAPLVYAPALQLIAEQTGVRLRRPVDRPRGLHKVVDG